MIFNFGGRLKNGGLLLGVSSNKVGSKIHCIANGRAAKILTTSPIRIRISNNDWRTSRQTKEKTMVNNAPQVLENTFDNVQVSSTGSMHKFENYMNCRGNIRMCHDQIHERQSLSHGS